MKFESGYTVETVFDGSKLGIEPYSVEVTGNGELLLLDSVNSNLYQISLPLSRCEHFLLYSYLEIVFLFLLVMASCTVIFDQLPQTELGTST